MNSAISVKLSLLGKYNVGKSTLLLDAVKRVARGQKGKSDSEEEQSEDLNSYRFWRGSAARMIAGMQYLGEWEERCEEFVNKLAGLVVEELDAVNNPEDPNGGTRKLPFSRDLYIERDDFMESPPPKYFRLRPGGEARLKYAYIIKCDEVVKDAAGNVTELHCTADLDSKTGGTTASRKVKGTIHWVSAAHAIDAEVRLYDRLFTVPEPDAQGDFRQHLNAHSLEVVRAKCEPNLRDAKPKLRYQFERLGYFCLDEDARLSTTNPQLVFNRTISLRDTWAKASLKA